MSKLFYLPRQVALDSSGTPYAGAKANFYLTGTSTPTNTYQDSALTTAHANPVVADSAGVFAAIYLDPDINYKLTLTQSDDTLIYTDDPISQQVTYATSTEETAASVTPTNYQYLPGDLRRYGAAIDGSTDDTTEVTNWINVGLQGVPLYHPGGTTLVSTWTQIVATTDLLIRSDAGGVIKGTSASKFVQPGGGDIEFRGLTFDTWLDVLENVEADSVTTDSLIVDNCRFLTMSLIPITHECTVNRAWITGNYFNNIAPAANSNAYCVRIGANTYASQDTWQNYVIRDNVADGIHATGSGDAAFCLVYGRRAEIVGNRITDVDTVTGECWAIYTKVRQGVVSGNIITDLVSTSGSMFAINLKGTDRGTSATPNGWSIACFGNVLLLSNDGYGIRIQNSDVNCFGNIVENADVGIGADQAGTPENVSITDNQIRISTTATNKWGVYINGPISGVKIADNVIDGQGGTGSCIRMQPTDNCSDYSVTGNICRGAATGISDNTTTAKVKTNYQINNNQFATLSGDAIYVLGAANVQIHDNHFESITGDYINFDPTDIPSKVSIKGNSGITVQTTDATATTIFGIEVADETTIWAEATAVGNESATADCALYGTRGLWYRTGAGGLTQQGSDEAVLTTIESDATWTGLSLSETSNLLNVVVQGVAAQTINWTVDFTCKSV